MTESSVVYESAVRQLSHHEDRLAKIRHGLRELKADAAAQSLHDGNGNTARAAFARFEGLIEQLLTIAGVLLLVCLLASPVAAAPDPYIAKGLVHMGTSYDPTHDETRVWYELRSGGAPAISNVSMNVCSNWLIAVTIEPMTGTHVPPWQPGAGPLKIETEGMGDTEVKQILLVYTGYRIAKRTTATWKAGQTTGDSEIYGVLCSANNVALTQLSARPIGLLGWLAGLLRVS